MVIGAVLTALAGQAFAGTVTGKVKNSVTGAWEQGVKVKVTQQTKSNTTNASGVYTITSVTAGTITLTLTKTGFITATSGNVVVPSSGTVTVPDLAITPMGTITGKVVSSVDGSVVASAVAKITGTTTQATTTSTGDFSLKTAAGSYTLTITKSGWVTGITSSFTVTNGQTTALGSIPLTPTATVTGTVKDAATNAVLASVTVKLHSNPAKTATTNSSGVFSMTGVPAGPQSLDLSKSSYVSATTQAFAIVAGTNNVGTLLLTKAAGTITGTIQDEQAGNAALAGVTVKVNSVTPEISTTTAADGTFTLAGVPTGTRTINASKTGFVAKNSGNLTVVANQSVSSGSIVLTRTTVTVTGVVSDAASQAAIGDATISVEEQPGTQATTDASGQYTLGGVYWGSIHLVAAANDYTSSTIAVTLTAGTNGAQDFELQSGFGAIAGIVVDDVTGLGLDSATVALESDPGVSVQTDAEGNYLLGGLAPGACSLTVVRSDYEPLTGEVVTVVAGTTVTAPVLRATPKTASMNGHVVSVSTGQPVAGVTVIAARGGQTATTDDEGYFVLTGLAPGYEVIGLKKDGFASTSHGPVTLYATQEQAVQFDIFDAGVRPEGVIHGTVRDSAGNPIQDVTVGPIGEPGVQTGTDGTYTMTVPAGRYAVVAQKPGFRMAISPISDDSALYSSSTWQIQNDLVLATTTETGTLVMRTVDPVLGTPAEAWVRVYGLFEAHDVLTFPAGERVLQIPPGTILGWNAPRTLPVGGTLTLDFPLAWTSATLEPPEWAIAGLVYNRISGQPIAGATVTLTIDSQTFTRTTDAAGRWSFASGPTGDYSVTISAAGGFATTEPFTFNAWQDGQIRWFDAALDSPEETGSLAITEPVGGSTLNEPLTSVVGNATLPSAGDYITRVWVSVSNGGVSDQSVVYESDGRHFRVGFTSSIPNGPTVITANARTRLGRDLETSVTVTVDAQPGVAEVRLDSGLTEVAGDTSVPGHVTLSFPAPSGGQIVALTSSDPVLGSVPASVTVLAGQTTAAFVLTTGTVVEALPLVITAESAGGAAAMQLQVAPLRPVSLVVDPTTVAGGSSCGVSVVLNGPAPDGGTEVGLASSNPDVVPVPSSVTIPAGATTVLVNVVTNAVTTPPIDIILTATGGGSTVSGTLRVVPIRLTRLEVNPSPMLLTQTATGTLTVQGVVPPGGSVITLASQAPVYVTVPAEVTVPAGSLTVSFPVQAFYMNYSSIGLTASYEGQTVTTSISIYPSGTVTGSVLDEASGSAIPGALVRSGIYSTVTDAAGGFSLGVLTGIRTLDVSKDWWQPVKIMTPNVASGAVVSVGTVALRAAGLIEGTVRAHGETGTSLLPGAKVKVVGSSAETEADIAGHYRIFAGSGSVTLEASASNVVPDQKVVEITQGQSYSVDLSCARYGGLYGRVILLRIRNGTNNPLPAGDALDAIRRVFEIA